MSKYKYIIFPVCLLFCVVFVFFISNKSKQNIIVKPNATIKNLNNTPTPSISDTKLTKNIKPVELSIVSPQEDTFVAGQARMWKGELINFSGERSVIGSCEWEFYLNENNSEVLYKQQIGKIKT